MADSRPHSRRTRCSSPARGRDDRRRDDGSNGHEHLLTTILYIVAGSVAYALVGVVFHLVFRALVKHDHNMFRILLACVETRGRYHNSAYWGGATLSPLKLARKYDERDLGFA